MYHKQIADTLHVVASLLEEKPGLTARVIPRPLNRPVRLTPSSVRPNKTFLINEFWPDEGEPPDQAWVSLGSVIHRVSSLHESARKNISTKGRPSKVVDTIDAVWPVNPRLRLSHIGEVKEDGITYFVYRLRDLLRFVPASAQPPKRLYMNSRELQEPLLIAEEATPMFNRLGRIPLPTKRRTRGLVDHPDSRKATLLVMPVALSQATVESAELESKVAPAADEFESVRATPDFRRWFEGASDKVRNPDGTPKVFFRGQTSGGGGLRSRLMMDSFTDSPDVASIYSTSDGVVQEGSNVLPVYIDVKNPLVIDEVSTTFYDLLSNLGYWDNTGLTFDDSVKMLNYLNNRQAAAAIPFWGDAPKKLKQFVGMPSFKTQLKNEEDTEAQSARDLEDYELINFDEMGGFFESALKSFRSAWQDAEDDKDMQERLSLLLSVDTFALIETPAAKRALKKLGYDGVLHMDPFSAEDAAQEALGKGMDDLVGVEDGDSSFDWQEMETDYVHWTVRPLERSQVWPLLSKHVGASMQQVADTLRVVASLLEGKLVLKDYEMYAKLVADAYEKAPTFDEKAVPSFEALIQHVNKMYGRVTRTSKAEFVEGQPYDNAEDMRKEFLETGTLRVSTDYNEHLVFSKLENLKFRLVHDVMSHIQKENDFSLRGEVKAYNSMVKTLPKLAVAACFTEVLGQACYYIVHGNFPEQKIALLPGFDYINVGEVEGYSVKEKTLHR